MELKSRLQVVVSPGQPADLSTTYGCCYIANVREGTSSPSLAKGVDEYSGVGSTGAPGAGAPLLSVNRSACAGICSMHLMECALVMHR